MAHRVDKDSRWFLAADLGGFGYAVPGLVCTLGIFLTVTTYLLLPSREKPVTATPRRTLKALL
jgi:hypothetical protein